MAREETGSPPAVRLRMTVLSGSRRPEPALLTHQGCRLPRRTVHDIDMTVPDLGICAQEPIHLSGAIQPHGCRVACDLASWVVTDASRNVAAVLGLHKDATLLGQLADDVLPLRGTPVVAKPYDERSLRRALSTGMAEAGTIA